MSFSIVHVHASSSVEIVKTDKIACETQNACIQQSVTDSSATVWMDRSASRTTDAPSPE